MGSSRRAVRPDPVRLADGCLSAGLHGGEGSSRSAGPRRRISDWNTLRENRRPAEERPAFRKRAWPMKPLRPSLHLRRRQAIYLIPNLFTTANLFCGLYSIIAAFNGEYLNASSAILVALIFDVLDGQTSRLTQTTRQFGIEFDSLADLTSFGLAPAVLVYAWALHAHGVMGLAVVFAFVGCGALRLARYNVQAATGDNRYFTGLPIPGAA